MNDQNIVTREVFMSYVSLQRVGLINMLSPEVREMVNMTPEQHLEIITNYEYYYDKYVNCNQQENTEGESR